MAHVVVAYLVMANLDNPVGLHNRGLYSYGLYSHGQYSYGEH